MNLSVHCSCCTRCEQASPPYLGVIDAQIKPADEIRQEKQSDGSIYVCTAVQYSNNYFYLRLSVNTQLLNVLGITQPPILHLQFMTYSYPPCNIAPITVLGITQPPILHLQLTTYSIAPMQYCTHPTFVSLVADLPESHIKCVL